MKPITCIIVDDEPLAVRLLESYVEKTPDLELMASFTDSINAINAIKTQKPDLIFLDIQMPNIDGMELAHSLPEETRVIFMPHNLSSPILFSSGLITNGAT